MRTVLEPIIASANLIADAERALPELKRDIHRWVFRYYGLNPNIPEHTMLVVMILGSIVYGTGRKGRKKGSKTGPEARLMRGQRGLNYEAENVLIHARWAAHGLTDRQKRNKMEVARRIKERFPEYRHTTVKQIRDQLFKLGRKKREREEAEIGRLRNDPVYREEKLKRRAERAKVDTNAFLETLEERFAQDWRRSPSHESGI
jgi:hypothetical protein